MAAWRNRLLTDIPISDQDRDSITNEIWGIGVRNPREYESYFTAIEPVFDPFVFNPTDHIVENYGQLADLISYLKASRNVARGPPLVGQLRTFWAGRHARIPLMDDAKILNSIELAVGRWLMISFGKGTMNGVRRRLGEPYYLWDDGQSLNSLLMKMFPRAGQPETYVLQIPQPPNNPFNGGQIVKGNDPPEPALDRVFSDLFTLWDMRRLAGFEIKWTDNILNHLLVEKQGGRKFGTAVFIYHHKTVLDELDGRNPQSSLGTEFTQETLDTLALLIPPENDCRYWYRLMARNKRERYHGAFNIRILNFRKALPYLPDIGRKMWQVWQDIKGRTVFVQNARRRDRDFLDPATGGLQRAPRRVCDYHYWRPRLLLLEKEFEESAPGDILRWWRDKRKKREWATFWIAFAGFIFALVALILTAISTGTGYVSMRQAQLQNVYAAQAANTTTPNINTCCAVTYFGTTTIDGNSLVATPSFLSNTTLSTSQESSSSVAVVTVTASAFVTATTSTTEAITTTIFISTTSST